MKNFFSHKNHLSLAHFLWQELLAVGDCVIDATAGNGHDTLELARIILTESAGELHVIDLQQEALTSTRKRLESELSAPLFERVRYYHQSHTLLPPCLPKLIVYNLGYLPGGDKSITTQVDSSLISVQRGLELIKPQGALSITCYPGHCAGALEEKALIDFAQNLDRKEYQVLFFQNLNRPLSPSLLWIGKN